MELLINQVSFSLPIKSFLIDYSVSQKRELPIVKEFVIRFLFSTEGCSQSRIANFFGFNDSEMQAVLNDLDEEGLVVWEGESVILSQYAVGKFENVSGNFEPRFFEIQDTAESISFDLLLYKILYKNFTAFKKSELSIDIPLKNYSGIIDNVESSFSEQFSLFQEKIHDVDLYENPIELYKINNITAQYDQIVPINVDFYVDSTDSDNIIMKYTSEVVDDWDNEKQLFGPIDDAIVSSVTLDNSDFEKYLKYSNDTFLSSLTEGGQIYIDEILNYCEDESNRWDSQKNYMMIGNLYTDQNIDFIKSILKKLIEKDDEGVPKKVLLPGALWFASFEGKSWGKTDGFSRIVEVINNVFDKRNKRAGLVLCTPCDTEEEAYNIKNTYKRTGAKLQSCDSIFGSDNTEILIIPGLLAITLYHFSTDDCRDLTIPVGHVTTDKDKIKSITKNIEKWSKASKFHEYFEGNTAYKDHVSFNVVDPVLNYYKKKK